MKLAWEKWLPLDKDIVNDGWEGDEEEYIDLEQKSHNMLEFTQLMVDHDGKIINNALSLYNLDDFNLWTGHSDFNISKSISNIICTTPGVESFDLASRYRFRIGIGKLFVPATVMNNISTRVLERVNGNDTKNSSLY